MNWKDWAEYWNQEIEKLGPKFPAWIDVTDPTKDPAEEFRRLDNENRKAVAGLAYAFAHDQPLPEENPAAAAMFRLKMKSAAELAADIASLQATLSIPRPTKHQDKVEWIYWFLVEAWESVSYDRIAGTLESLRRADTDRSAGESFSLN